MIHSSENEEDAPDENEKEEEETQEEPPEVHLNTIIKYGIIGGWR